MPMIPCYIGEVSEGGRTMVRPYRGGESVAKGLIALLAKFSIGLIPSLRLLRLEAV
jgi:hypothetical protein